MDSVITRMSPDMNARMKILCNIRSCVGSSIKRKWIISDTAAIKIIGLPIPAFQSITAQYSLKIHRVSLGAPQNQGTLDIQMEPGHGIR